MNLREIDRLVAEKMMGWEVPYEYDDIGIMAYTIEKGTFAFSPTTNIADAWQVVDKVAQTHGLYQLIQGADFWIAEIQTADKAYFAEARTAPLAICLAALKSFGVEVDN